MNRRQNEIDFDTRSFEIVVTDLNKDICDNCDQNECHACEPECNQKDIIDIALELDHAIKHNMQLVHFR